MARIPLSEILKQIKRGYCGDPLIDGFSTYEDYIAHELSARGAIIPPCVIGDTVYFDHLGEPDFGIVKNVKYNAEKDVFTISGEASDGTIYMFSDAEIFYSKEAAEAIIESRREKPSHRIGTKVYWQTCAYEIKRGAIKEYQYDGYTIRYIILVEDKTGYEYTMKPEDANKVFFYKKKDLLNKIK